MSQNIPGYKTNLNTNRIKTLLASFFPTTSGGGGEGDFLPLVLTEDTTVEGTNHILDFLLNDNDGSGYPFSIELIDSFHSYHTKLTTTSGSILWEEDFGAGLTPFFRVQAQSGSYSLGSEELNADSYGVYWAGESFKFSSPVFKANNISGAVFNIPHLGGSGDRMVIANNSGDLSTQAFPQESIIVACSDRTTAITTGEKEDFFMPLAKTLMGVKAGLTTAQSSGSIFTVDVRKGGVSVLSTLITVDNGETNSVNAVTQPVISTPTLEVNSLITFHVTQVGDGTAAGLKVTLIVS